MMRKILPAIFCILLSACATMKNREAHDNLIASVEKKDYPAAVAIAKSRDFYPEDRSELLRRMETASAYYLAGMNYQALLEFDAAKNLSDALYTKSISSAAASMLDDNNSEFYGERFERSQIRFYQSLVHYKLAKFGKYEAYSEETADGKIEHAEKILSDSEKKFHLNAAKSVMQEWNSIFAQYRAETEGRPAYKTDLTEMLWGAFVHEQGSSADRQTALALYKQARDALFKNFNIYPVYNGKFEKFAKDFSKLSGMPEAKVKSEYIDPTAFGAELSKFIDGKIKKLEKNKRDNFTIVIKDGLVAAKSAKEYKLEFNANEMVHLAYLGAYLTAASGGSRANVSNAAFISFATTYLLNGISFEFPYIVRKEAAPLDAALVSADGKTTKIPLVISSPLSDIAFAEIDSKIGAERAELIARLTAEYIAAAATAYVSYVAAKSAAGKNSSFGELLAIGAAVATFKGSAAAIRSSNRADIRQWKLLPSNIRIGGASVKPGEYKLTISGGDKVVFEQYVSIGKDPAFIDANI